MYKYFHLFTLLITIHFLPNLLKYYFNSQTKNYKFNYLFKLPMKQTKYLIYFLLDK